MYRISYSLTLSFLDSITLYTGIIDFDAFCLLFDKVCPTNGVYRLLIELKTFLSKKQKNKKEKEKRLKFFMIKANQKTFNRIPNTLEHQIP